ncbi:MAG: segregation/condensation protein A [Planctomycetota bacterium]|nr:segregation/condensation protein A [Planctomycetota bacterium]
MLTEDYRVRLEDFEGPLDLLLFLIRKDELDVHDIPIARITDQYLAFLARLGLASAKDASNAAVDIDVAGEFLVMAATLMEIKSRMIGPRPTAIGEAGENPAAQAEAADPRAELVQQLLAFKKYRDAAGNLEDRLEQWRHRFPARPIHTPTVASPATETEDDEAALGPLLEGHLDDLELTDLIEAFRRIMETVNFDRLGDHQVKSDDTPLELHAEDLLDRLRRLPTNADQSPRGMTLLDIFKGRTKPHMVGLFLAMLELVKRGAVGFRVEASATKGDPASIVVFEKSLVLSSQVAETNANQG